MPFSQSTQISTIMQFLEQAHPHSILDVGMGMGQYGFLSRVNLENENLFEINGKKGRLKEKHEWTLRIDGIEGCGSYITPVHEFAYNAIVVGDALEILPATLNDHYDIVLAIDILEHFDKKDGLVFLKHLKRITKSHALVSTPKALDEPNSCENQHSLWSKEELIEQGFDTILENPTNWIAIYKRYIRF